MLDCTNRERRQQRLLAIFQETPTASMNSLLHGTKSWQLTALITLPGGKNTLLPTGAPSS